MNAVIWFPDKLEAHRPTPPNPRARRAAPAYCATTTPASRSAPKESTSGIGNVSASASHKNRTCPRYLPASSSASLIGCASTTSNVPLRDSSARARIVTAGTKKRNTQGSRSSIGLIEAACIT